MLAIIVPHCAGDSDNRLGDLLHRNGLPDCCLCLPFCGHGLPFCGLSLGDCGGGKGKLDVFVSIAP